ncbi:short neuropeptide F isoform X2 [Topomyia yanbarensis]|uniref:short neuropeptide F isoform X2 n=1 Tax=Topomyia yanbarensis TaxID=2498891 RepID=UPI00273BFA51|nr:short neuropeptide F isoform X2 [Topomyia yanbarensis]
MYRINLTTLSLLLVLGPGGLMSELTQNADGTIKDLYEYLLQREYAAPVSYADHQIKRKAVRSPSLRLRFGRRSDPSMPVRPEDDDMVDSRSIRAPQLRLRFGRRDPMWSSFNENALLEENFDKRAPSQRLRWGRSGGLPFINSSTRMTSCNKSRFERLNYDFDLAEVIQLGRCSTSISLMENIL